MLAEAGGCQQWTCWPSAHSWAVGRHKTVRWGAAAAGWRLSGGRVGFVAAAAAAVVAAGAAWLWDVKGDQVFVELGWLDGEGCRIALGLVRGLVRHCWIKLDCGWC